MKNPTNVEIADLLDRIADVLEVQDANPFRIRAYREGATTIRFHDEPIADFIKQGRFDDLIAMPHIGEGIVAVIREYISEGRSGLLEDLEAEAGSEAVLIQVPGIGPELAHRIVEQIKVETLPELEAAAHDGRLADVRGFGERRVAGVQKALAGMLSQSAQKRIAKQQKAHEQTPSVEMLLELDTEYRNRARADELHKIAPRRFNPANEAWLPVMHTKRGGWLFTILFSNTAQAHQLDKTNDWVVIYYERNGQERQNTVVTETKGPLEGKRVVRGRANETQEYYGAQAS